MILQSAELPPSQNAAIKDSMGLPAKVASPEDRQQAANQMRYQLYLLDRSERRMSIEDCMAAMLEQAGTELPA
jgi:hypothetical protein